MDELYKLFKFVDGYPAVFDDDYKDAWLKFKGNSQTPTQLVVKALKFMVYAKKLGFALVDKPIKADGKTYKRGAKASELYYSEYINLILSGLGNSVYSSFKNTRLFTSFKVSKIICTTGKLKEKPNSGEGLMRYVQASILLQPRNSRISVDALLNELAGSSGLYKEVPLQLRDSFHKLIKNTRGTPKSKLPNFKQLTDLSKNVYEANWGWYVGDVRGFNVYLRRTSDGVCLSLSQKFNDLVLLTDLSLHEKYILKFWENTMKQVKT